VEKLPLSSFLEFVMVRQHALARIARYCYTISSVCPPRCGISAPQIQLWCWHCAPYKCSYYYYYYYYYYCVSTSPHIVRCVVSDRSVSVLMTSSDLARRNATDLFFRWISIYLFPVDFKRVPFDLERPNTAL